MTILLNGKEVAQAVRDDIQEILTTIPAHLPRPCLHTILVGEDPASQVYVRTKQKRSEKWGMRSSSQYLPEDTTQKELEKIIHVLNAHSEVHGILVQLPLPPQINTHEVMDRIDPKKDVDGFTAENTTKLYRGEDCLEPCTPKGILRILDHYDINTQGMHAVIVGRSDIVGKPMYSMLSTKNRNATVTLCHSRTKDLPHITRQADLLIAAIGKPNYITEEMVKEGAVVIDVGINQIPDPTKKRGYRLVGDVDFDAVYEKVSAITPVPGGVGPMTIASLMENTMLAYMLQHQG